MFSRDGDGLYFSSVILTTLGFGDLIPGTPVVAMMASIEALLGQMYVAIAIARIVGLKSLDIPPPKEVGPQVISGRSGATLCSAPRY